MNDSLKLLFTKRANIIAFTGAGVSTLSGIKDFRGKNGIYTQKWHGYQVEEILSLRCFSQRPELFYEWGRDFIYNLENFCPSQVHCALAKLEQFGILKKIYTQNIDFLHTRAGSKSVYEIHGSPAWHHCMQCGASASYDEIAPVVRSGCVPRCLKCNGIMKPDIVFYGESLDNDLLQKASFDFYCADVALILGSSLTVYPAAGLPEQTVLGGGTLVIVNAQPTYLDRFASFRYDDLAVFAEDINNFCVNCLSEK